MKENINPFLVWTELALKTGEMMMASAQVVQHRTSRMASAGPNPSVRDRLEFSLMGQEKLVAAGESLQGMAARMLLMNQQIAMQVFKQMMSFGVGLFAMGTSRSAAQSSNAQGKLIRDSLAHSADTMTKLNTSLAEVAHKGLKPIHSRAKANAKRLGKLK